MNPQNNAASIVIPSYNNKAGLEKVLNAMLQLNFAGEYEIIVVDDGSTDGTKEMLIQKFKKEKKISLIFFENNQGVCKARNAGIAKTQFSIVINMDHDCVPGKNWLTEMIAGFDSEKIGIVTGYGGYGGTSTGFRKKLLEKVHGYDETYRYYREDTDLAFKIMELGYELSYIKAKYNPLERDLNLSGWKNKFKYLGKRLRYHMNDVLLYKKHPTKRCEEFLKIKFGFLVSPKWDFNIATGTWENNKKMTLSSPRGINFLENKSFAHFVLIVFIGLLYVFCVKLARLTGSIRFGKLLV